MNGKLFIGGKWVESHSKESFTSLNPATEKSIGRFQKGNAEDVKEAIDAAEKAYENWKTTPAPKRGLILLKAAELLQKNKPKLAEIVTIEMGKPLAEGRSDVQEAIDAALYFAGEGRRLFGYTTTSELRNKFSMTIRMPVGVCGLITPWNFPIAIPAWKAFAALICGNPIIIKPSSDTPMCATAFVQILENAGIPKGVVNLVTGPGDTVGMELARNNKIKAISFTGHRDTGASILKSAGLKRVGLELGSKNGIIILDDADLSLALDGALWGGFGTTGQRCSATSRLIIQKGVVEKFQTAFVNNAKKLRIGSGLDKKTDIGPLVNKAALEKVSKYTQIGVEEGAKLLCGGRRYGKKGYFYEPTIFTNVSTDMRIAQEEIFGPVISIIVVESLNEAIEVINSVDYGLTSSIYTKDVNKAMHAIHNIEAGITYVNSPTIGSEVHLPFGGVKKSGNTREGGIMGIDEFSEIKTVYIDYSGKLQKAQFE